MSAKCVSCRTTLFDLVMHRICTDCTVCTVSACSRAHYSERRGMRRALWTLFERTWTARQNMQRFLAVLKKPSRHDRTPSCRMSAKCPCAAKDMHKMQGLSMLLCTLCRASAMKMCTASCTLCTLPKTDVDTSEQCYESHPATGTLRSMSNESLFTTGPDRDGII